MTRIPDDAYVLSPAGRLGGLTGVSQDRDWLGDFDTAEAALAFVRDRMDEQGFYPDVVWVSDHGNWWPIDLDGNELPWDDDDDDDDEPDSDIAEEDEEFCHTNAED